MLKNEPESTEKHAKYFQNAFSNSKSSRTHFKFDWEIGSNEVSSLADEIFPEELILSIINQLPKRKAPGNSGLTNEMITIIRMKFLSKWFKFCFNAGKIPSSWNNVIIPIFKKDDKSKIENYRPISLLENIRKIYERCLQIYIKENMHPLLPQQGGFRTNCSTFDQIVSLQDAIKIYKERFKKFPTVTYLDIKAAYDSVDRNILYQDCIKKSIKPEIVETLKQLFEFNKAVIRIRDENSRSFAMKSGVQQGSILSPLLYSIFIEKIITEVGKGPGITIYKDIKLNCLLYADDIAIIGKNIADAQELLEIAGKVAEKNNFEFNTF